MNYKFLIYICIYKDTDNELTEVVIIEQNEINCLQDFENDNK